MYDVPREHYASVIRELIRHENDVTNHRIMWLLVFQGLITNAYVNALRWLIQDQHLRPGGQPSAQRYLLLVST